jgi:hypothetical protein
MPDLPLELLILFPLALAAGLDLYLTLLVLGVAPMTPWWDHPLPGALGDLDGIVIVMVLGLLYLAELAAERFETSALVWNATHAWIRPLSGALLGALLLHGLAPALVLSGAAASGAVASVAHAVRSGAGVLRRLDPSPVPDVLLFSLLEDAVVLGLVAACLDAPLVALAGSLVLVAAGVPRSRSRIRAFLFVTRLAMARLFQPLGQRSWIDGERLPGWVREELAADVMAPGGGLRGSPAAVLRGPGLPLFATGWVVIRGDSPSFVHGRYLGGARVAELGGMEALAVIEHGFFRALDLRESRSRAVRVFFFVDGPSPEGLAAEFLVSQPPVRPSDRSTRLAGTAEKNL